MEIKKEAALGYNHLVPSAGSIRSHLGLSNFKTTFSLVTEAVLLLLSCCNSPLLQLFLVPVHL